MTLSPLIATDPAAIEARTAAFKADVERFGLRFRCRDCSHVVTSDQSCSLGFPNAMLRDNEGCFDPAGPPGQYAFCKYFEVL